MPNQVFISYKNKDDGVLTKDAEMAKELHDALSERGIDSFFATDSLRGLGADDYSTAIDKELDSCCVLVVVTTSVDHVNSRWVKYEWNGYHLDILDGTKKGKIFTYIDDIAPHDLPRALRHLQSFVKSECTMNDIVEHIENAVKEFGSDSKEQNNLNTEVDSDKDADTNSNETIDVIAVSESENQTEEGTLVDIQEITTEETEITSEKSNVPVAFNCSCVRKDEGLLEQEEYKQVLEKFSIIYGYKPEDRSILFGKENPRYGAMLTWEPLDIIGDRLLLLSRRPVNTLLFSDTDSTWTFSSIRHWLNNDFLMSHFSEAERYFIDPYLTEAEEQTYDHVFLLSVKEAQELFENELTGFSDNRESYYWWSRTCFSREACVIRKARYGFLVQNHKKDTLQSVRPAIYIKLDKLGKEYKEIVKSKYRLIIMERLRNKHTWEEIKTIALNEEGKYSDFMADVADKFVNYIWDVCEEKGVIREERTEEESHKVDDYAKHWLPYHLAPVTDREITDIKRRIEENKISKKNYEERLKEIHEKYRW